MTLKRVNGKVSDMNEKLQPLRRRCKRSKMEVKQYSRLIMSFERFDAVINSCIVSYLNGRSASAFWFCCKSVYVKYIPFIVPLLRWKAWLQETEFWTKAVPTIFVRTKHAAFVRRVHYIGVGVNLYPDDPLIELPFSQIRDLCMSQQNIEYDLTESQLPSKLEAITFAPMQLRLYKSSQYGIFAPLKSKLPDSLRILRTNTYGWYGSLEDLFVEDKERDAYDPPWWQTRDIPLELEGTMANWRSTCESLCRGLPRKLNVKSIKVDHLLLIDEPKSEYIMWPETVQTLNFWRLDMEMLNGVLSLLRLKDLKLDTCPNLMVLIIHTEFKSLDWRGVRLPASLRTLTLDIAQPKKVYFTDEKHGRRIQFEDILPSGLENLDLGEWCDTVHNASACFPSLQRLYVGTKVCRIKLDLFPRLWFVARSKTSTSKNEMERKFNIQTCSESGDDDDFTNSHHSSLTQTIIVTSSGLNANQKIRTDKYVHLVVKK